MNESKRNTYMVAGGALVLVAAACYMLIFKGSDDSLPDTGGKGIYYTGPMKSKMGSGFGTMDGQRMTDTEGQAAADAWLRQHPELAKGAAASNTGGGSAK